ncbi:MAG: OmpP1/FadL family transporter [Halocynthiibacter sp.]
MKKLYVAGASLALSATTAFAGGMDRSGQNVGIIFEKGNYVEFSIGSVRPEVSGTFGGGAISTGDIAEDYTQIGFGYKHQFNDKFSLSLIYDQPFGADIQYPANALLGGLNNANAQLRSTGLTVLGRYKIDNRFSVHGGISYQTLDMNVELNGGVYKGSGARSAAIGYVIGAAYEIPEIAGRVALTYRSETEHDVDTNETLGIPRPQSVTTIKLPKSVNLDFQTGIAADTLLFGQVRWADWTATEIYPAVYKTISTTPLVGYRNDVVTLSVGVGRKFSDQWSGAISFGYEKAEGGKAPNLGPTDGKKSITAAAVYNAGNGLKITGGVSYVKVGNAISNAGGTFNDNKAVGFGLKVSKSF